MRTILKRPTAVGVALVVLASACGNGGADDDTGAGGRLEVVATTSVWADIVSNIACGDAVDVATLIPPGGDPHGFEPSLADRRRLDDAALVVANGLGLEEGLEDTLDAVAEAGTPVVRVGAHVDPIDYRGAEADHDDHDDDREEEDHEEDDHDESDHDPDHEEGDHDDDAEAHDHDGVDPHVWFDPVRISAVLPELGEELVVSGGLDRDAVERCIDTYMASLASLDQEVAEIVSTVPESQRRLVTNHDALGYFADRYGFEVVGTVIPTPSGLAETNPAQLEALAVLIEDTGVPVIFAETQHSDDDARALADRVGDVAVVTLLTGTLSEPGGDADTYLDLVRHTAQQIASALG